MMVGHPGDSFGHSRAFSVLLTKVRRLRHHPIAVPTMYLMISCWILCGIFHLPWSTVPTGSSKVATVPLLNMWTIWWNCDQLGNGFSSYWNAPIFHPVSGALSFSEPQTYTVILWPLLKLTDSLVITYKVWLLIAFTLNGFSTWILLRDDRIMPSVAFGAGVLMQTLPILFKEIDAVQICHLWPCILVLRSVRQVLHSPTPFRGFMCGLWFATSFMICIHQTLLLALSLAAGVLVWLNRVNRRLIEATIVAGLTAAPIVVPIAAGMQKNLATHSFERSVNRASNLSANWGDYTRIPNDQSEGGDSERALCPGYGIVGMSLFACVSSFVRKRRRWWIAFLASVMVAAVLMSLGPRLTVLGYRPWIGLRSVIPGVDAVRNVFRFAIIAHISLVMLAALGLHYAIILSMTPQRSALRPVILVVSILMLTEAVPPAIPVVAVPDERQDLAWVNFLARQDIRSDACVCLPMATDLSVQALHREALWMFHATRHRLRLANGYSGFFPNSYLLLRDHLRGLSNLRDRQHVLDEMRLCWLVVHNGWKTPGEMESWIPTAHVAFSDIESQVTVYKVVDAINSPKQ